MNKGKKILVIVLTLICLLCVGVDIWCFAVYKNSEEVLVSDTYNFDLLETENGEDKKAIFEINYFSNKNKNGLEMFEIKYNQFQDENMTNIISIGSQYIADSESDKISFNKYGDEISEEVVDKWFIYDVGRQFSVQTELNLGASYYEYQSSNDFMFTFGNDINSLNADSKFLVEVDNKAYYLGFKKVVWDEKFYIGNVSESMWFYDLNAYFYSYVDHTYFAYILMNSCKDLSFTSGTYNSLQFADLFDVYKYEDGKYELATPEDSEKIKTRVNYNFIVKINISEDGARVSEDSLFNVIKGDENFNLTGDKVYQDYYYGKQIYTAGLSDFDILMIDDKYCLLQLSEEFIETYLTSEDSLLTIDINLTDFDYEFVGFTTNSFVGLNVVDCNVYEVIDGEIVDSGVEYVGNNN